MFTLLSIIMNFVRLLEYELKFFIPTRRISKFNCLKTKI